MEKEAVNARLKVMRAKFTELTIDLDNLKDDILNEYEGNEDEVSQIEGIDDLIDEVKEIELECLADLD